MNQISSEIPLTRSEASQYIEKQHGKAAAPSPKTLAKQASVGGGPEFIREGRRVAYLPSELDRWVLSRRSNPMKSTSNTATVHVFPTNSGD